MLYENLRNNIIINKNKIEHIIKKISKYVQIGGEKKLADKMKINAMSIVNMVKIKQDVENVDIMLKKLLVEIDELIMEINNAYKISENIKNENKKILEEQYKNINKLAGIDNDNQINYEDNGDYEEKFIINLKFLYFGLFDESAKIMNSIKTKKEFDYHIINSLDTTITKVKSVTKLAAEYILNIEKKLSDRIKNIEKLYSFKNIQSINDAKIKLRDEIKPIKNNIIQKKEKLIPVNLTEIVREGQEVLKMLKINESLYTFGKTTGDTQTRIDIFIGGNFDVIKKLNELITSLDECERTLEKISEVREKNNLLTKQSDDFVKYIIEILNRRQTSAYTHINKNMLEKYLEKIGNLQNPNSEYYMVLKILDDGFTKILKNMGDEDVIQIDKLEDIELKNLFTIFNDFYDRLD
jgi:hypothetical protein